MGDPMTELRSVTCRTGSYSVTCYPTQVNASRHNPSKPGQYSNYLPRSDGRLSRPRYSPIAAWPGIEPTISRSQVRRYNHYATESPKLELEVKLFLKLKQRCLRQALSEQVDLSRESESTLCTQGGPKTVTRSGEIYNDHCMQSWCWVCQWNNFEDRSTSDAFITKICRLTFSDQLVVAPRSEDSKLINSVITFELTQHIRPRYINVTDRQTDRRMTYCIAIRAVKTNRLVGAYARSPAYSWADLLIDRTLGGLTDILMRDRHDLPTGQQPKWQYPAVSWELRCLGWSSTDGVPTTGDDSLQSSSSSMWSSQCAGTICRSGSLTVSSLNDVAGWSASSSNKDTLNT